MARVYTTEELQRMPMGYGWMEIREEPEEPVKDPEELMMAVAWVGKAYVLVDRHGACSYSSEKLEIWEDADGVSARMWNERPTVEERTRTEW